MVTRPPRRRSDGRADDHDQSLRGHERVGRVGVLHLQGPALHARQVGIDLCRGPEDRDGLRLRARRDPAATRRVRHGGLDVPRHGRDDARYGHARRHQPGNALVGDGYVATETAFGLVYGLGSTPTNVTAETLPSGGTQYQFAVTAPTGIGTSTAITLYDVIYRPGSATNVVQVDVPPLFPSFTQTAEFTFATAYPLSLETGGYNAYTFSVAETSLPAQTFAASYKTPVTSTDPALDNLMTPQGDFSVEFWHSIPSTTPVAYHPFTYQSSGAAASNGATAPVSFIDVDFEDASDIYLQINSTVMQASVVPPVFTSKWQHFALSYTQPYVMVCEGAGFAVQNGTNYNVEREFSIAFTFSVSDADTMQGLVYKGSGSSIPSPEYVTSYSVYVDSGQLVLVFQDGVGQSAVQDVLRRLGALDFANSIVLFGASLLLSVLPFIILLSSLANHRIDTDLSRHIGLNSAGARIVSQLFRSSPAHSAAPIVTALILAAAGTMAVAGSLQAIYEQVFGQPHRGWRDVLRFLTWAGVLFGVLVAESVISKPIGAAGGPVARGLLTYAGTAAFFWWTMHFLLAGRVPWRRLMHAAILTALLWIGLELFSAVYFSSAIISDSRLYGTIGVVFTLLTWFIAIGAVIVLGAVMGATWDQRKGRSGSTGSESSDRGDGGSLLPGPQPDSGHQTRGEVANSS